MDYLDDKGIVALMRDYLSENIYNYAVMIDGDWGSGKTYFVKDVLLPALKVSHSKRIAIYISLYGLKGAEEITNSIFTSIVEYRLGKGKKILPILNGTIKAVTEVFGSKLGSDTVGNTDISVISPFISYDDYYFIFDDLERCSMPINEVLGYINHFLENNKSKILIIANEKEVGSVELIEHNLIKYLISIQDSVKWPEREIQDLFGRKQKVGGNTPHKPDIDEIKWRNKLLSDENTFYQQVKEKLVGRTLYYRPSLQNVVPDILSRCISKDILSTDLKTNSIRKICAIMESENHYNLRTLQFALVFFSKVCSDVPLGIYNPECYEEMLYQVLEAVLRVSIANKNGELAYRWDENSEYGTIKLKETWSFDNFFTSFRFIHEYVYCGSYDKAHVQVILGKYLDGLRARMSALEDPTNRLRYYWEMEDEDIITNLRKLFENLKLGKYKGESYRWILSLLFKLKGIEFEPIPIEEYLDIMVKHVTAGESIDTMQEPIMREEDEYIDDYVLCLENLRRFESATHQKDKGNSINAVFDIDIGWGNALYDYYTINKHTLLAEHGFFKYIDLVKCMCAIERESVKDLSDFRRAVATIYDFSNISDYYSDDAENIDKLIRMLDKSFEKKMIQYNINLLIDSLKSIRDRLK